MNPTFWKSMQRKRQIMLHRFRNFAYFCLQQFCITTILKTTKHHKVNQGYSRKLFCKLHLNGKIQNNLYIFLRTDEFWPTFDVQNSKSLAIYLGKSCRIAFTRKPKKISKHVIIYKNRNTRYKIMALYKNENVLLFDGSCFKNFEFFMNQIIGQRFCHIWKIKVYGSTIVEIMEGQSCYSFH